MKSGEKLIATASALAVALSEDMNFDELLSLIELLGLLKHNLEVIKTARVINKIEDTKK